MDFRQDYSTPFTEPFIPSVAQYGNYWVTLISSSKAFSYPGPRCAISVISPALVDMKFPNLKDKCGSETFGHSFSHGGLYVTTSGVSHVSQHGLSSLLNAACDGSFNFVEHTREYSSRSANLGRPGHLRILVANIVLSLEKGHAICICDSCRWAFA